MTNWAHANYGPLDTEQGFADIVVSPRNRVVFLVRYLSTGVQVAAKLFKAQDNAHVGDFLNVRWDGFRWTWKEDGRYDEIAFTNGENTPTVVRIVGTHKGLWNVAGGEAEPASRRCKLRQGADSRGPSLGFEAGDEDGSADYNDLEVLVLPG